ncbi:MBL fold metallo-hydrolase [Mycoplana ramosa]|uniref:MBL fold metallo-hydrolase n=2 Tax=Mycoplana ramosa TaxID=40837 RepID=A0ABW3YUJ0_MYCRA
MNMLGRPPHSRRETQGPRRLKDNNGANDVLSVRFWGTRGSIPVSGAQFSRYGGNTVCVEIRCGDNVLVFDAGSGIPPAGLAMKAENVDKVDLFFSHCHYDHIIGLPYFKPLYSPDCAVNIWSGHLAGVMTTCEMVCEFMQPPWFPVDPKICRAHLGYRDFRAGDVLEPRPGVTVQTGNLNHPGGAIGYRIEWNGRSVAMITDTEHVPGTLDPEVLRLIENVDLFIYDCCYTDEEMEIFKGFGHSTWQQAIRLARAANAKAIAFIHHAPWRTDAELEQIDRLAAAEFPTSFSARDGQVLEYATVGS